jgi:hypothetical protein
MSGRFTSGFRIAVATGLAVAASVTPALAATHTAAKIYEPFTAAGAPSVHVSRTIRGSCFSGSDSAIRKDAWRCMSGNFLYDPCFSSSKANFVLCPAAPGGASVIKLKLTHALPHGMADPGKPSTKGLPWSLETTSGAKCAFAGGATSVIGGRRLNYFCGKSTIGLWGSPNRKTEPWTIFSAPFQAKKLTQKVGIKTAWF